MWLDFRIIENLQIWIELYLLYKAVCYVSRHIQRFEYIFL